MAGYVAGAVRAAYGVHGNRHLPTPAARMLSVLARRPALRRLWIVLPPHLLLLNSPFPAGIPLNTMVPIGAIYRMRRFSSLRSQEPTLIIL
jgi:hypothetical protein